MKLLDASKMHREKKKRHRLTKFYTSKKERLRDKDGQPSSPFSFIDLDYYWCSEDPKKGR